jgi:hypothetical protein
VIGIYDEPSVASDFWVANQVAKRRCKDGRVHGRGRTLVSAEWTAAHRRAGVVAVHAARPSADAHAQVVAFVSRGGSLPLI